MLTLRTNPYAAFATLRNEMDRLFEGFASPSWSLNGRSESFAPALNVWEDDAAYHVEAELPGFQQRDIDISIDGDRLTIKGERSSESTDENANFIRRERWTGRFERSVMLPAPVDPDQTTATLTNGVLSIRLDKRDEARARRIPVTTQ